MERSTKTLARIEEKLDRLIAVADAKLSGAQVLGAAISSGASLDDTIGTVVAEVRGHVRQGDHDAGKECLMRWLDSEPDQVPAKVVASVVASLLL